MFPLRRPKLYRLPERCSPSSVRFAAPNYGAPLTAVPAQMIIATGGSGGNMTRTASKPKTKTTTPKKA